jgi:hypothetical protein
MKDKQTRNPKSPTDPRFKPPSNVTTQRDLQPVKQYFPISSTLDGMKIDKSGKRTQKRESPINHNFEPDSNATDEKDRQPLAESDIPVRIWIPSSVRDSATASGSRWISSISTRLPRKVTKWRGNCHATDAEKTQNALIASDLEHRLSK